MKKGEVRSGEWQRPALSCCCRNEKPILQLFLMRSSTSVKRLFIPEEASADGQGIPYGIPRFSGTILLESLFSRSPFPPAQQQPGSHSRRAAVMKNSIDANSFFSRLVSLVLFPTGNSISSLLIFSKYSTPRQNDFEFLTSFF